MKIGRPAKLDDTQIAVIRRVARERERARKLPTNAELAEMLHVHPRTIDYWLADERAQIRAEKAARERQMRSNSNFDSTPRIQICRLSMLI